jgi:hypothetical protein
MAKTKKLANQKFDIYIAGRNAALNNSARFAPYRFSIDVDQWFAGYDSVKTIDITDDKIYNQDKGVKK